MSKNEVRPFSFNKEQPEGQQQATAKLNMDKVLVAKNPFTTTNV